MPTRRALLALSLLTLADAPQRPTLVPGREEAPFQDAMLSLPNGGRFSCPPFRARLLAELQFRAGAVCAIGFACDAPGAVQDVLAFVAADGSLLALERLGWTGQGVTLTTRLAMLPDRTHLALQRSVVIAGKPVRREAWTDYLRRSDIALTDAPARPVMPGSFQQALATERLALAAQLVPGQHQTPMALRAALRHTPFNELRLSALHTPKRPSRDAGEKA